MRQIQLFQTNHATGKTEEFIAISFAEEIARGIKFLDAEKGRKWPGKIDPTKLDLSGEATCVCGQLFNRKFSEGLDRLEKRYPSKIGNSGMDVSELAYRWGFTLPLTYENDDLEKKALRDSRIAWDWAANYYSDGKYETYGDLYKKGTVGDIGGCTNALWSLLTEQWIATIKELKGERGIA